MSSMNGNRLKLLRKKRGVDAQGGGGLGGAPESGGFQPCLNLSQEQGKDKTVFSPCQSTPWFLQTEQVFQMRIFSDHREYLYQ